MMKLDTRASFRKSESLTALAVIHAARTNSVTIGNRMDLLSDSSRGFNLTTFGSRPSLPV